MDANGINSKPVVAIDIDEVLAQFLYSLNNFHNKNYGTSFSLSDYYSYEFVKIWGGSLEECSVRVREFFDSEHIHDLNVVPGSLLAMKALSQHFSLHIVTARQDHAEDATRRWITTHFPEIFTDIHFGNHYSTEETRIRSKAEICKHINAILLVDDSLSHCMACSKEGIRSILFGDYPWNRPTELDIPVFSNDGDQWMIKEARCWEEVLPLVMKYRGDAK